MTRRDAGRDAGRDTGRGAEEGASASATLTAALEAACAELHADAASNPGRILIGLSGGRDSSVLLHAAATLWPGQVSAIHVNHGLHSDSGGWQTQSEELCRRLTVTLSTARVMVESGSDLEARARRARYAAMAERIQPGDRLLLAHHAGDQIESQLLHLLQGRGLFGMPARRTFAEGQILRPFLALPSAVLGAYAREHGLVWVEDPSNQDLALDRNFLRHAVLPMLEARFPHLDRRLSRVQSQVDATATLIDELLGLDRHPLPLDVLDGYESAQRPLILRAWLIRLGQSGGFSDGALANFVRQLEAPGDRQPELRGDSSSLRRYRGGLYLVEAVSGLADSYPVQIPGRLTLPHGTLVLELVPQSAAASGIETRGVVQVRFLSTNGGASGVPVLKVRGQSRAVPELLRAAGVPPWERGSYPLLVDDRGLLAVPGIASRDPEAATQAAEGLPRLACSWQVLSRRVPER